MADDMAPWDALNKRKLSKEHADSMEGDLTIDELENFLYNHMNSSSSTGIRGFTIAFLRVFWTDMRYVVKDIPNSIETDWTSRKRWVAKLSSLGKETKILKKLAIIDQYPYYLFFISWLAVALLEE
jgi:hypothetical protein